MKANLYQEPHRITTYETNVNQCLSLKMLLNLLLMVSGDQNHHLGIKTSNFQSQHLGWVVVQYSIHLTRLPKTNERVVLATQADRYNQFIANRNFAIKDADGQPIVKAQSNWIVLDLSRRRLVHLTPKIVRPYGSSFSLRLPHLTRPKLISDQQGVTDHSYRVRYSDIDSNRHVDNACYLDWMVDVLSPRFLDDYVPKIVNLKFSREVRYGSIITSRVKVVSDRAGILTKHEIIANHHVSAIANVKWVKRR